MLVHIIGSIILNAMAASRKAPTLCPAVGNIKKFQLDRERFLTYTIHEAIVNHSSGQLEPGPL